MNRYISPKKWHHDPFGCCRLQCGDCSRERNQRAQCKMLDNRNRQKTRNHFESFWRLCPWPTKATHLELTFAPTPPGETERIRPGEPRCAVRIASPERRAGARQIHNLLGCRSAPGRRALLRVNPRSGFPRSPPPRGRAPRGGRFGEPSSGSPGSAPLLYPGLPSGPAERVPELWAGQVGFELEAAA